MIYEASVGVCGSSGDSTIWKQQPLYKALTETYDRGLAAPPRLFIPESDFIACDQAYALRSYQICPFSFIETTTRQRELFNFRIRKARRIVERVFGILKKRWRILIRPCETGVARKTQLVWTLLILHNMILRRQDENLDEEEEEEANIHEEDDILHVDDDAERGHLRREQLVQQLWLEFGDA